MMHRVLQEDFKSWIRDVLKHFLWLIEKDLKHSKVISFEVLLNEWMQTFVQLHFDDPQSDP